MGMPPSRKESMKKSNVNLERKRPKKIRKNSAEKLLYRQKYAERSKRED